MTNPTDSSSSRPTRDQLYKEQPADGPFEFSEAVAQVFPDMLARSVPGYRTTLATIGAIAGRYAQPGTRCYDLGCSLGAATAAMRSAIPHAETSLVAIDNAPAMVNRCRERFADAGAGCPVEVKEADITQAEVSQASVVVLNFTLQFVPLAERDDLIRRIATGMVSGGVLLLSEKVLLDDPASDALFADLHHAFKASQGYSRLEIARKRSALENVLIRETLQAHKERLTGAGLARCEVWFQCFNFASLMAFRP
ncbi:MAG: carboxy-S-adenosyl-L-methionine synthase CmoA [Pseudomonadota bacterium]